MVSKAEVEGKAASKIVYIDFAPRIAVAEGKAKEDLTEEAHLKAIAAAKEKYPSIDIKGIKKQLGSTVRTWNQKNLAPVKDKKLPDNGEQSAETADTVAESPDNDGNDERMMEEPLKISPEVLAYIDEKLAAAVKKPEDDGQKRITVPQEPPDPRVVTTAARQMADKVVAHFEAIIEKIYMDDYRKALFSSWKAMSGYKGDLGDFIIEAFDMFFKIKGIDLEIVQHRPLNVEKGMFKTD